MERSAPSSVVRRTSPRFNGATAFRRWKAPTVRSRAFRQTSFNGATALRRWKVEVQVVPVPTVGALQWGHRLSAMERTCLCPTILSPSRSFNGATALRRWKRPNKGQCPLVIPASMGPPPLRDGNCAFGGEVPLTDPASMGPPPLRDGNGASCRMSGPTRTSFNGATASRRWKRRNHAAHVAEAFGFNGATAFRQWKPIFWSINSCIAVILQWGHHLSAVETTASGSCSRYQSYLQWGHRLSPVETSF